MRVQIADNHELSRLGLRGVLVNLPEVTEVLPDLVNGQDLLRHSPHLRVDALICDAPALGLSAEGLQALRWRCPAHRVVIYATIIQYDLVQAVARLGMSYLAKSELISDYWLAGVSQATPGQPYFSPKVQDYLAVVQPVWGKISNRERQVLSLWAQGYDAVQIANTLVLAPQTVYNIQASLRDKFGVRTNNALLLKALTYNLVPAWSGGL